MLCACAVVLAACDTDFERVYGEAIVRRDAAVPAVDAQVSPDAGTN